MTKISFSYLIWNFDFQKFSRRVKRKNSLPDLFCVLFALTIQLVIAGMTRRIMTDSPSARPSTLFNSSSCAHDSRTVRKKYARKTG